MIHIYRGYQVKAHKQYPQSYIVAVDGRGGGIPSVLDSLFTSIGTAKSAIDIYLDNKPVKKETTYGRKTKSTGGDK